MHGAGQLGHTTTCVRANPIAVAGAFAQVEDQLLNRLLDRLQDTGLTRPPEPHNEPEQEQHSWDQWQAIGYDTPARNGSQTSSRTGRICHPVRHRGQDWSAWVSWIQCDEYSRLLNHYKQTEHDNT